MGNLIVALSTEWNTSGFKVRMLTRIDMGISISLMILYTLWLFELPREWDPDLKQQGPLEPRQMRIFCFFIYIVALLINGFQFFTSFLMYGSVLEGIHAPFEEIISTAEYYIGLLFTINVITLIKFYMLLFYLEYAKTFTIIMTIPEFSFHTIEIILLLLFVSNLKKKSQETGLDEERRGDDDGEAIVNQFTSVSEVEVFRSANNT